MITVEQKTMNPAQEASVPADNAAYLRRRSYKRWMFPGGFVVLAVSGSFFWHYLSGFESTNDALHESAQ